jgi:uncharacterized membrane protein
MTFPSRSTSLAATAAAAAASALAYPFLPDRVATHVDDDGQPDRYGSRAAAVLGLPALMLGMTLLNDRLGAWPGGTDREDGASGARARDEAIGLVEMALVAAHLGVLANGLGVPVDMSRVSRGVYGVLMIGLGNLMPRLPRNGLVGIRTPWTLADPAVWERTHRVGGYLVTAAGLASLVSVPASGKRAARLPTIATLGAVGISVAYSLVAYAKRSRLGR